MSGTGMLANLSLTPHVKDPACDQYHRWSLHVTTVSIHPAKWAMRGHFRHLLSTDHVAKTLAACGFNLP